MKNIVLITVDSLRADHLSCLGYHRETTPNLDKLAKDGVLFTNAISCGPDTLTSMVPMLFSNYTLRYFMGEDFKKGMTTFPPKFDLARPIILEIYRDKTAIGGILSGCGYDTAAFHSNPLLSRYYNFGREFDHFYDSFTAARLRRHAIRRKMIEILKMTKSYNLARYTYELLLGSNVPFERAELLNRKAIAWLKEQKEHFFVWLHYMDVHRPYKPPRKFQFNPKQLSSLEMSNLNSKMRVKPEEMKEEDIRDIIDLYDGEIRYNDYAIKSLLEEMREMGILDDTVLIITADHGEEFGEHGDFAHHHAKLYEELIRVPLIIANSESKNIKIDEQVSLIDVAPTILDLLDIPASESFQGRSLVPVIKGEKKSAGVITEAFGKGKRNVSYRTKEWKYILNEADAKRELYNLREDPGEKRNLYGEEKERVKEFELKIKEHVSEQRKIIKGPKEEKERIKQRIRELKYYKKA